MNRISRVAALLCYLIAFGAFADSNKPPVEAPDVIPFTLFKTGIVIEGRVNDSGPLHFVFDTGVSRHNILSQDTARTLNMQAVGSAGYGDASGSRGNLQATRSQTTQLGGVDLGPQIFAMVPLPDRLKIREGQPPIAGYTGPPLLEEAVLCIDYQAQALQRYPRAGFDAAKRDTLPMPLNHDLMTVSVEIDGRPATLAIDTGADEGINLFREYVREHDLLSHYPDLVPQGAISGSGRNVNTLSGTAGSVQVGGRTLSNISMLFMPQAFDPAWGIDGLLGYAALAQLNPCLDREGARMMLAPAS